MMKRFYSLIVASLLLLPVASAQSVAPQVLSFSENKITAHFELTSPTGQSLALDLRVDFERTVGLSAEQFVIEAEWVNPLDLLNRLPTNGVNVPAAFPVVVRIAPHADRGFSFEGVAQIEFYTKALHYVNGSPLRLYRSHANGPFEDITQSTGAGSIRARGNTGSFSDFIILADTRTTATVLGDKLANLSDFFSTHRGSINPVLADTLVTTLDTLSMQLNGANYNGALQTVNLLINLLEQAQSADMPYVWRASDDLVNVRGELLTLSQTLGYSLRIL
ncbi:hypothetical protein P2G88_07810 [Aliiglaciecola sp. CAU 1673]|uniref:DUF6689 family protein n=1 Tax=Aliiglaciecola sp. CAU 1673 TaxID=3032595 RepID=UPI0023DB60B5|nr:DUF6689 family protein [Aliiglaciecola sp. CAU 1673]MDF2178156.1 hypothetical protein [Aliiglaciecola sp. CAU 1673]